MTARIATTMCGLLGTMSALAQTPLGTSLTYQGRLDNSGSPANGLHDMQFQLFTALSGGSQVGSTICRDGVNVVDGLFAVSLDFGAAYDGNQRFLAVAVRPDSTAGNCASGAYTALSPRQALTAAPYALKVPGVDGHSLDAVDGSPVDAVFVDNAGNVGIGTNAPINKLHVIGGLRWGPTPDSARCDEDGSGLFLEHRGTSAATSKMRLQTSKSGDLTNYSRLFIDPNAGFSFMSLGTGNNNVGIGTATPVTSLHVNGQSVWLTGGNGGGFPNAAGAGLRMYYDGVRAQIFAFNYTNATPRDLVLQDLPGANVGIGTSSPQAKLDVNGTTRTNVLEITGADLAERFPASEQLEPGMVVAIDRNSAGKLCLARGSYNRCVAGVVSGANNFSVGAVLGNLPGHENAPAIALSGRVYVQCDASAEAIEPGNLLTTSDTAGHAMKATDRDRSHGAVIGKAMTALAKGERGMVLVLVNLQ